MLHLEEDDEELPALVQDYRTGKSFGEVANASIADYSFRHRQRKWPHAGLTFVLHAAIHNAWTIYKMHTGIDDGLLDFLRRCLPQKLRHSEPNRPNPPLHLIVRATSEAIAFSVFVQEAAGAALLTSATLAMSICIQRLFLRLSSVTTLCL